MDGTEASIVSSDGRISLPVMTEAQWSEVESHGQRGFMLRDMKPIFSTN